MSDADYARYEEWKGWGDEQFMVLDASERAYFDAEFAGVPVKGEKALEIGFGRGALLAWLRERGASVHGTELSAQGRALAAQQGVTVLDLSLSDAEQLKGTFGLIAAFDVLEHLTHQEIADLLDKAAVLLRPGGHLIARFPNGASPFGRINQHGDITHVTTMTEGKLAQIMLGKPFRMIRAGDSAEAASGGLPGRLMNGVRSVLRRGFEFTLFALYKFRMPFGPNLTVVLQRLDGTVAGGNDR